MALVACALVEPASAAPAAHAKPRALFPPLTGAVPVLLYHRPEPATGADGLPLASSFEAQMLRLRDLGFQAITLDEYVRFVRGEPVVLPPRPVLLTFDDARRSALTVADPVLARMGWPAAMYVPTGFVGRPSYLTWSELAAMQASGRWQIDEHAGDGHTDVTAGAAGRRLPFYAAETWSDGKQETFAHYTRRVSADIERGAALLAQNLRGWASHGSFAVPFGDYGQRGSNDPRIEPWLTRYLQDRFTVVFVQRGDELSLPGAGFQNRITVERSWDADMLETHLRAAFAQLHVTVAARRR